MDYLVVDAMQPFANKASKDSFLPSVNPIQLLAMPSSPPTIITTTTPIVAARSSPSSPLSSESKAASRSPSPDTGKTPAKKKREKSAELSPSEASEGSSDGENEDSEKAKKRHRRTASEIERNHICKAPTCGKAYGSEGALKMHMRLKHPDFIQLTSSSSSIPVENSSPPSSPSTPNPSIKSKSKAKAKASTTNTANTASSASAKTASTTPKAKALEWNPILPAPANNQEPSFTAQLSAALLQHQPTPTVVSSPKSGLIPMWSPFADPTTLVPIEGEDSTTNSAIVPQFFVTSPLPVFPENGDEEYKVDFSELKEKYSHIPLLRLNIGLWQAESQCPGDLIAKFSYQERCIIWEIFDVGSLMRTVISFDELNGIGLELHPDDTITMIIELKNPPSFFKGILQPYESTVWNPVKDFTAGMASAFRRHILHFARRTFNEPVDSIFRRDPHLQNLLLQGLPALKTPYF